MLMTAFNPLPLPISKSISWTRHVSTHRYLQPVKLGPGITVWPLARSSNWPRTTSPGPADPDPITFDDGSAARPSYASAFRGMDQMTFKEACRALGVPLGATLTQIKAAQRVMVKRYHPDLNPDPDAILAFQTRV